MDEHLLQVRISWDRRYLQLVELATGRVLVSLSLEGLQSDTIAKLLAEAITPFCEV